LNPKEGYFLSFGNDVAGVGGDEKYAKFDAKASSTLPLPTIYTFKLFAKRIYYRLQRQRRPPVQPLLPRRLNLRVLTLPVSCPR
jgi:hypothetical protein